MSFKIETLECLVHHYKTGGDINEDAASVTASELENILLLISAVEVFLEAKEPNDLHRAGLELALNNLV